MKVMMMMIINILICIQFASVNSIMLKYLIIAHIHSQTSFSIFIHTLAINIYSQSIKLQSQFPLYSLTYHWPSSLLPCQSFYFQRFTYFLTRYGLINILAITVDICKKCEYYRYFLKQLQQQFKFSQVNICGNICLFNIISSSSKANKHTNNMPNKCTLPGDVTVAMVTFISSQLQLGQGHVHHQSLTR